MAAQLISLGKLTVPAPGTPVAVSTLIATALPAAPNPHSVHAFLVEVLSGNTGKIYLGIAGLNKATLAGVIIVLAIPTTNVLPTFSCSITQAANALSLDQLWVDVDNATDGVLVSCIVC